MISEYGADGVIRIDGEIPWKITCISAMERIP
jgi:hypothetical protein